MKAYKIWFDEQNLHLQQGKGKIFTHALSKFPLLEKATTAQRENYSVSPFGIHWPEIDEDLSFEGLTTRQQSLRTKQPKISI